MIRTSLLLSAVVTVSACGTTSTRTETVTETRAVLCPPERVSGECPACPKHVGATGEDLASRLDRAEACEAVNTKCRSWHIARNKARALCEAAIKAIQNP